MASIHRSTQFVIGLTGPLGAGVSTLSHALASNGFHRLSLSDPIKAALKERDKLPADTLFDAKHLPDFRKRLQDLGNEKRSESRAYWVDKALTGCPTDKDLVLDGIRNLGEVETLRDRFSRFFLIAVHASPETRWRRLQDVYDKDLKTFERDDSRDSYEENPEGQQVEKCVLGADFVFRNDDNAGASESQRKTIFSRLAPDLELMRGVDDASKATQFHRVPTADEVNMAMSYAQSQASRCLKRHVGAVIVGEDGFALSVGYNENPTGMKPCEHLFGYCYKDQDMLTKLEGIHEVYCSGCGVKVDQLRDPWKCTNPMCGESFKARLFPNRNMELCTAVHAEERAIRSLYGRSATNGTLYTTTFPCFQCARLIVDAGIRWVVFVEAYPVKESFWFLEKNQVLVEPFTGFKARAFNLVFRQVE
jgi:deoxycytidylate deaminase